MREQKLGAPLPFGAALKPNVLVVTEAGDYEKGDGLRVVLSGNNLVFLGEFEGISVTLGVGIDDLLEAITVHNRTTAS